ncbi:hypothetical protein BJP34_14905 [Moorena producens PAL-8-15-08-1]|uniref:Uncharacterized protein n=1 Tax=Moorena producens PAL-8-15-08-1 TaxID=1458985 RepID=A0A1D8TSM8_9CYAN|nr:hypothetical protein BJP34_14905 [Moorena producens PAL-8-15-08-1]
MGTIIEEETVKNKIGKHSNNAELGHSVVRTAWPNAPRVAKRAPRGQRPRPRPKPVPQIFSLRWVYFKLTADR